MNRLVLALAALFALTAAAGPPPHNGQPVNDVADIITAPVEAELNKKLYAYQNKYGHQLAVVTVTSLDGRTIEELALDTFRSLKLGHQGSNDGVLLLVAPNDREMKIETGDGMSIMLTDAESSWVINDNILPRFKEGKLEQGIIDGVDRIIAETSVTKEQLLQAQELAAKERAFQAHRRQVAAAKFWDFVLTTLGLGAIGGGVWGVWFAATAKRRRLRREEEARKAEAARIERQRLMEEARQAEIRAIEQARREREAMLAAMTPAKRKALLERERAEAEAARAAAAAAAAERRRLQAIEDERQRIADEARRAREAEEERNRPSPTYSSSSDDDDGPSFSGFGGTSNGSGAVGRW